MTVNELLAQAKKENRSVLTEIEAKQVLSEAGINCNKIKLARDREQAVAIAEEIGFPVVLKISSVDITHKSDAGGVKVNLNSRQEVEKAFDEIMSSCKGAFPNANIEGISVQGMAEPGIEIILGMIKDASFGPVVMFGLGGVFVEVLKDVSFRVVPIEKVDAREMIYEIQGKKLLEGYRGQPPADVGFLQEMLVNLSNFVDNTPEIKEIDMNPVFAYEKGAVVVDARIILEE